MFENLWWNFKGWYMSKVFKIYEMNLVMNIEDGYAFENALHEYENGSLWINCHLIKWCGEQKAVLRVQSRGLFGLIKAKWLMHNLKKSAKDLGMNVWFDLVPTD